MKASKPYTEYENLNGKFAVCRQKTNKSRMAFAHIYDDMLDAVEEAERLSLEEGGLLMVVKVVTTVGR